MARQKFIHNDAQGRMIHYSSGKNAPSLARIREVLRQAEKAGAKRVGVVGQVDRFQGYEMRQSASHIVRGYGKNETPASLRAQLHGVGSEPSDRELLAYLKRQSGADSMEGLHRISLNFIY